MDNYVTGSVIRRLREDKNMTQAELAAILDVSPKTVSKWETAKGLPDISLLDPLAAALEVSVMELQVLGKNEKAQQFWKQQGMETIGLLCCKYL